MIPLFLSSSLAIAQSSRWSCQVHGKLSCMPIFFFFKQTSRTSHSEEQREGSITFHTNFEDLRMTVRYHAIKGSLTIAPSIIQFDTAAFPGRMVTKAITAKSTYRYDFLITMHLETCSYALGYSRPIRISSITSSDARLIPVLTNTTLEPGQRCEIGY